MPLAIVNSRAQTGIESSSVIVEVDLAPGLPSLSIVGLAETAVKESKDRVRSAIRNAGFEFPNKRITVNLAPADLPKEGGRFDLPIAVGILAASRQVESGGLSNYEFFGELALDGGLRGVPGVLPSVIAANASRRLTIIPEENAEQASLAPSAQVYSASHLLQVSAHLSGAELLPPLKAILPVPQAVGPDLADVCGQLMAKRALTIAAAGGHNLLLAGPPGTGKTMLAQRLTGLLPPLNEDEALESASVWSLTQRGFDVKRYRIRPFRSPHHSISAAALVGGGSQPRPGEISLAHHGVLFLDELPEFGARVLDQLREPMETGEVHISRVAGQQRFPASFQLIAAMNLCKCGKLGDPRAQCRCSPEQVRRYQERVSGPLLDRIDLHVHVKPVSQENLRAPIVDGTSTRTLRAQVLDARCRQIDRQNTINATLHGWRMASMCHIDKQTQTILDTAMERFSLSARSYHRLLRVARTIADLDASSSIEKNHLIEAIQFRALDIGN